MASTTFTDFVTPITASWLNDVNSLVWTVFNGATSVAAVKTTLSIPSLPVSVVNGGTALSSGTSGGILGYTATGVLASSVLLTANALVLGGGATATPIPMSSLGTTTTVLHGNAAGAPTFGSIVGGDFANQTANQIFAGPSSGGASAPAFRALVPADLSMTPITNSLSGDVTLNNTANYFDGPSVAQGTSGTWFASGTVSLVDSTANSGVFYAKLWDGTTVIASGQTRGEPNSGFMSMSLSGYIASPAGNIRISVRAVTNASNAKIVFNATGTSKDSTISAMRIA